jgi:O-antigen/teichoic acid export membrane protein
MGATLQDKLHTLLRKTEKYTKTDMVYLASGGFWLGVKVVLGALLSLALSLAYANLLPQTIFGEYKYVFSVFGFLALAGLPGMSTSVVKSIAQGFDGTAMAALKIKIKWGVLGGIGAVCVGIYYFIHGNIELAGAFFVSGIFLPVVDAFGMWSTILNAKKLFRISAYYEIGIQAICISILITTLFFTNNLIIILLAYFGSYTTARFLALRTIIKHHTVNQNVDPTGVGHGKHLSAMEVMGTLTETVEGMLLWQFLGPIPLAIYSFSKAIPNQINAALKRIVPLSLPKFAQREMHVIKKTLIYRLILMFVFLLLITGAYIIVAPYIYQVFFPKYVDSIFYSQLYILTLLFFPKKILGTILNAHGHVRALYINSVATPVLKLIILISLVPSFGILGAVFSELVSQLFSLVLLSILFVNSRD